MLNSKAFNKIEIKKIFNRSFTTDSVKALKHFFEKAGINDVVMFFYAGHGYLDEDLSLMLEKILINLVVTIASTNVMRNSIT